MIYIFVKNENYIFVKNENRTTEVVLFQNSFAHIHDGSQADVQWCTGEYHLHLPNKGP